MTFEPATAADNPPASATAPDNPPANANSGRRVYFRKLMRGKPAVYGAAVGCAGAFVFGASRQNFLIMAAGPAAVAAFVTAVAALLADRRAAQNFFRSYAEARGLDYVARFDVLALTPLLGAGDRQWYEHWMIGDIASEPRLPGGLGHFVYERRKETTDSVGNRHSHRVDRHHLTVCVIDMEESLYRFKGVFLRRRRGLLSLRSDWLADTSSRAIEVESTAFTDRYELRIADDQDEIAVRQLLSPTLVSWLAGHPLAPGFELRAGTLVVFVPRALEDGGTLTFFADAAREIAGRVLDEVREAAATGPGVRTFSAPLGIPGGT
jgi:hypothetical protein